MHSEYLWRILIESRNFFQVAKKMSRSAFVGYVCACDPRFRYFTLICKSLIENGVDVLELGVPFSDPLADGLTNQLAAQRALESGCRQDDVFSLVEEIRKFSEIPIVFYTYYNLVFSQELKSMLIVQLPLVWMVY